MMRLVAWAVVLSLFGCSSNGLVERPANADADDAEVSAALRSGAPRYTKSSPEVVGKYSSAQGCPGGFDVCDDIEVRRKGAGLEVSLGMDRYVARVFESRGALVFSVDGLNEDCDDPGCGNLTKISGVIYATRLDGKWVPRIKATVLIDFPFPDEEGAPEGEVKTVVRLDKN